MTHLYLIRHAVDRYELDGDRYRDLGLSPEGIQQAERLRDRLAASGEIKPDVLICSDEPRAHETAQIIAPALDVPVIPDKDFQEWRSEDGSLTPEEFMSRWEAVPKSQKAYYRWIEGYENRAEFTLRVHLAVNRVLQEYAGKTIVLVTHGAFIQVTFGFFFGYGEASLDRAAPEIRRTSITHWYKSADQDRWTLERSNDCHHLPLE